MFLGVVLHAAIPFSHADWPWVVREATSTPAYDLTYVAIHGFRMPLFFLLAGFFGHLQQNRLGPLGFLRQRLLRIGLPFVVGMMTLIPWMGLMTMEDPSDLYAFIEAHHIPIPDSGTHRVSLRNLATAHLWFLEVLLICYGLAALATVLTRERTLGSGGVDRLLLSAVRAVWPIGLFAALGIVCYRGSRPGDGVPFLDYAFIALGWKIIAYSLAFFVLGWWLYGNPKALRALEERWVPFLGIGGLALLILLGVRWRMWGHAGEIARTLDRIGLLAEGITAWFLALGLFAWGLHALDRPIRWARYFADSSYWLYLIHLPVMFWIQRAAQSWPVPIVVKFVVSLVAVTAFGLLSYQFLVRNTWIGWILNGRRSGGRRQS